MLLPNKSFLNIHSVQKLAVRVFSFFFSGVLWLVIRQFSSSLAYTKKHTEHGYPNICSMINQNLCLSPRCPITWICSISLLDSANEATLSGVLLCSTMKQPDFSLRKQHAEVYKSWAYYLPKLNVSLKQRNTQEKNCFKLVTLLKLPDNLPCFLKTFMEAKQKKRGVNTTSIL